MKTSEIAQAAYEETMGHSGHRLTPQRREVYDVLLAERDHPTATEVFLRAKTRVPSISLATVYNCLETLVECGLVRQVNVERDATRFCPNVEEHGHFLCTECAKIFDIPISSGGKMARLWQVPEGFTVTHSEITLRGRCSTCDTH